MVLLGGTMVFYRSLQTTVVSGTVWPQFAMQVLTGGCESPVWEKGWSQRVGYGSPDCPEYRGGDFR